jgi:hypothetical protein
MAMDAENGEWTMQVSKNWENRDGDIEGWICSYCGCRSVTEMRQGVRKDAMLLCVWEEKEA